MVAYSINVDVLNYNKNQLYTFTFKIMAKSVSELDNNTEKIIETCKHVYQENREGIIADLHLKLKDYTTNTQIPSLVPDNNIVLCQLYSASINRDLDEYRWLLPFIFKEEARRSFRMHEDLKIYDICKKLLNINLDT